MNSIQPVQSESNLMLKKSVDVQDKTVVPIYIWKTARTIVPSKKEDIVLNTYLGRLKLFMKEGKTMFGVYKECVDNLAGQGFSKNWLTCKRWLDKEHIRDVIDQEMRKLAMKGFWTKDQWQLICTDHLSGRKLLSPIDFCVMKEMARVCGFEAVPEFNFNQQINFTQADGRA